MHTIPATHKHVLLNVVSCDSGISEYRISPDQRCQASLLSAKFKRRGVQEALSTVTQLLLIANLERFDNRVQRTGCARSPFTRPRGRGDVQSGVQRGEGLVGTKEHSPAAAAGAARMCGHHGRPRRDSTGGPQRPPPPTSIMS